MTENETPQSKVIDFMRFPMILMVIFIHQNPVFDNNSDSIGALVYNIICSAGSHVLSQIAVPMFFFFSGFLYFFKVKSFGAEMYFKKTKKRFKSLILPYIYWNLIAFFVFIPGKIVGILLKGEPMENLLEYLSSFSIHTFWDVSTWPGGWFCFGLLKASDNTGPEDLPLWFLRNLIIIMLLSPVIYWFIKRFGKIVVMTLGFAYLSGVWLDYAPLGIIGIFYFSLGSYIAINKIKIACYFGKYKYTFCVFAIIMSVFCIYLDVTGHERIYLSLKPTFVLCGLITAYNAMSWLVKTGIYKRQNPVLSQSSFFVYAIHTIMINGYFMFYVHKVAKLIFFFSPTLASIIGYIVAPFMVGAVCLIIYLCMKKLTPNILGALTGNR